MSNIRGLGLDLFEIKRAEDMLEHTHFLSRCFTPGEIAYVRSRGTSSAQTLAGLYAAKEAIVKAIGCGIAFPLTQIEITHSESGQPTVSLSGTAASYGGRFLLSITHDAGVAAATALWIDE